MSKELEEKKRELERQVQELEMRKQLKYAEIRLQLEIAELEDRKDWLHKHMVLLNSEDPTHRREAIETILGQKENEMREKMARDYG